MDAKLWYTSKTLWFNLAAILVPWLAVMLGMASPTAALPMSVILPIGNIVLRVFFTKDGISFTKEAPTS